MALGFANTNPAFPNVSLTARNLLLEFLGQFQLILQDVVQPIPQAFLFMPRQLLDFLFNSFESLHGGIRTDVLEVCKSPGARVRAPWRSAQGSVEIFSHFVLRPFLFRRRRSV